MKSRNMPPTCGCCWHMCEGALHSGAQQFYDKDKPPFVLAHADYMGLILTVVVMVGS